MKTNFLSTANSILAIALVAAFTTNVHAQAVTEIVTDYNGYWKSSSTSQNPIQPDNDHNLLAFTYGGTTYSTGVNDAALTSNAQSFVACNFRALPTSSLSGTANSSTKIGLGAMRDGVYNGAGATAPSRSLSQYLNDGSNGLNIGTCVANLPAGSIYLSVANILTTNIGDNIPDMVITQTADPDANFDHYEFTDINGNRIGNTVDIVLNNIAPVGKWVADFYEATGSQVLTSGFTQTSRNIRLWAADFSAFGINASNVGQIAYFKITVSGNSDIAFVAYNTTTISLNSSLNIPSNATRLTREINSTTASRTMNMYPNPASCSFAVAHDVARENEKVMVYNMQGVLMANASVSKGSKKTTINISSLKAGAYQVVYTDGNDRSSQMLLVK